MGCRVRPADWPAGASPRSHSAQSFQLSRFVTVSYSAEQVDAVDRADSALGSLITKGNYLGSGSHGVNPSGTSAYNSIDIGLIHVVCAN
jgi:hypothetical protein